MLDKKASQSQRRCFPFLQNRCDRNGTKYHSTRRSLPDSTLQIRLKVGKHSQNLGGIPLLYDRRVSCPETGLELFQSKTLTPFSVVRNAVLGTRNSPYGLLPADAFLVSMVAFLSRRSSIFNSTTRRFAPSFRWAA